MIAVITVSADASEREVAKILLANRISAAGCRRAGQAGGTSRPETLVQINDRGAAIAAVLGDDGSSLEVLFRGERAGAPAQRSSQARRTSRA